MRSHVSDNRNSGGFSMQTTFEGNNDEQIARNKREIEELKRALKMMNRHNYRVRSKFTPFNEH